MKFSTYRQKKLHSHESVLSLVSFVRMWSLCGRCCYKCDILHRIRKVHVKCAFWSKRPAGDHGLFKDSVCNSVTVSIIIEKTMVPSRAFTPTSSRHMPFPNAHPVGVNCVRASVALGMSMHSVSLHMRAFALGDQTRTQRWRFRAHADFW